jgi:methylenetetrahydrofolate--tRNA-(uracil-5-)-methyltransferase
LNSTKYFHVIGAGLAGSEAAFQLARLISKYGLDYKIRLYEMRPYKNTPAHHTGHLAELVCSNSLGSEYLSTARGLLIEEMKSFNSLIIDSAIKSKVPAGQALAVDRELFARNVSESIIKNPFIELVRKELREIPEDEFTILATGPLTSEPLAEQIRILLNSLQAQDQGTFLHFFDAASPIISAESINMQIAFKASRYDKGEGNDYINCPFYDTERFRSFYESLISAERAPQKDFEKKSAFFESCLPIEEIARRGLETMRYGPLKPVGIRDPKNPDKKPYAVVQLRQDNVIASLYNMVGFQTNLKWGEQQRVFSMIPGLENMEILRYGVMHKNIYINSPLFLKSDLSLKNSLRKIFFAGQITGVEGYTESAAMGIVAAHSLINRLLGLDDFKFSKLSMMGALAHYIANADPEHFQPINSNWGLINPNPEELPRDLRKNKKNRNEFLVKRALDQTLKNKEELMV